MKYVATVFRYKKGYTSIHSLNENLRKVIWFCIIIRIRVCVRYKTELFNVIFCIYPNLLSYIFQPQVALSLCLNFKKFQNTYAYEGYAQRKQKVYSALKESQNSKTLNLKMFFFPAMFFSRNYSVVLTRVLVTEVISARKEYIKSLYNLPELIL